jgi:hypothetical protein
MGWHGMTEINEELSLENCWLNTWDYVVRRLKRESGSPSPFCELGVTDDAKQLTEDGNAVLENEGQTYELTVGKAFTPATFKPLSNKRLIEMLAEGTEGKDIVLASNGTVRNRGRQFLSFEMGESYRAAGRDFRPFFNIGNGNDMSSPIWQNTSSSCTVCDNTFSYNMHNAGLIMAVKKTKFSELKLADFSKAMKAMLMNQKEFAAAFENLGLIKVDENTAREFFVGLVGTPNKPLATRTENIVDRLVSLFKHGKGNEGKDFADVFSAVTDYYTHEAASGAGDDAAKWKNFVSSEFGAGQKAKENAWIILNNTKQRNTIVEIGRQILRETEAVIVKP